MDRFLSILLILISLLFCLSVHELGHFILGRIFKVRVREFSIGIGPKIFYWTTKSGIIVSFRPLPVAAYVMFDSYELREMWAFSKNKEHQAKAFETLAEGQIFLNNLSLLKTTIVALAGIMMNFIFFGIFFGIAAAIPELKRINVFETIWTILKSIFDMLTFNSSDGILSGLANIGTGSTVAVTSQISFGSALVRTIILLNLSLGVLNILPIPPLDGSRVIINYFQRKSEYSSHQIKEFGNNFLTVFTLYFLLAFVTAEIRGFF